MNTDEVLIIPGSRWRHSILGEGRVTRILSYGVEIAYDAGCIVVYAGSKSRFLAEGHTFLSLETIQ